MANPADEDHAGATVLLQNPQTGEGDLALIVGLGVAQLRLDVDDTGALPANLSREHDMASLMATMATSPKLTGRA